MTDQYRLNLYTWLIVSTVLGVLVSLQLYFFRFSSVEPVSLVKAVGRELLVKARGRSKPYSTQLRVAESATSASLVPMPFTTLSVSPHLQDPHITTNDLGFFERENYTEQIALAGRIHAGGGRVIVVTGGGTLMPERGADGIVDLLNARITASRAKAQAFNFGMEPWTSSEELAAVLHWAMNLEPDVIIVHDGYNDLSRCFTPGRNANRKVPFGFESLRDSYPTVYSSTYLDHRLRRDECDSVLIDYRRNLETIVGVATIRGRLMVVAPQAIAAFHNDASSPADESERALGWAYDRVIAIARGIAHGRVLLCDTSDAFAAIPSASRFFADARYLTLQGRAIIVEKLFETLGPVLAERRDH